MKKPESRGQTQRDPTQIIELKSERSPNQKTSCTLLHLTLKMEKSES